MSVVGEGKTAVGGHCGFVDRLSFNFIAKELRFHQLKTPVCGMVSKQHAETLRGHADWSTRVSYKLSKHLSLETVTRSTDDSGET
jgi:hypothetical protein